jgi:plasmid replication initiation protein
MNKHFITEAARMQKLANISEAKVIPVTPVNIAKELADISNGYLDFKDFKEYVNDYYTNFKDYNIDVNSNYYKALEFAYDNPKKAYEFYNTQFK